MTPGGRMDMSSKKWTVNNCTTPTWHGHQYQRRVSQYGKIFVASDWYNVTITRQGNSSQYQYYYLDLVI